MAYPQGGKIYVMNNADGDVIPGMYITNDAWVVDNILNGDGMTDGVFKQGDWFKLTITPTTAIARSIILQTIVQNRRPTATISTHGSG